MGTPIKDDLDNHANQLNPNNDEYWNSRGLDRPDDDDDEYDDRPTYRYLHNDKREYDDDDMYSADGWSKSDY